MIRYSCTSCQRKLLIKPELAGKPSKCPCGATFTVPLLAEAVAPPPAPAPAVAPSQPAVKAPEEPPITVACTKCDRLLRTSAKSAGKAIPCKCGSLVLVPSKSSGSTVVSKVDRWSRRRLVARAPSAAKVSSAAIRKAVRSFGTSMQIPKTSRRPLRLHFRTLVKSPTSTFATLRKRSASNANAAKAKRPDRSASLKVR